MKNWKIKVYVLKNGSKAYVKILQITLLDLEKF